MKLHAEEVDRGGVERTLAWRELEETSLYIGR